MKIVFPSRYSAVTRVISIVLLSVFSLGFSGNQPLALSGAHVKEVEDGYRLDLDFVNEGGRDLVDVRVKLIQSDVQEDSTLRVALRSLKRKVRVMSGSGFTVQFPKLDFKDKAILFLKLEWRNPNPYKDFIRQMLQRGHGYELWLKVDSSSKEPKVEVAPKKWRESYDKMVHSELRVLQRQTGA